MATVDKTTTCGLGNWRPDFLQPLASKKVYMFFYGALGIIQGMFFTYLSATISTLEKKFGIKSKEAAYLMSGNEISQVLFLFAMPFLIRIKRRPLWTAAGLACTAVGCFLMAVPHFTASDYYAEIAEAESDAEGAQNATLMATAGLCGSSYHPNNLDKSCDESGKRVVDWAGLFIVFFGIVLTGVGNCAFYTFGVAYLDDNTSHENSPILLGITYTFRLLGPTFGFFLGSFCLQTYVYPSVDPGYEEGDPRWIGAWWLGYPIIGALIVLFAGPLTCFPQRLPKKGTDAHLKEEKKLQEADETDDPAKQIANMDMNSFRKAMKRLLKNKLFMYNFFSSIFYVFAFMGFGTFMPKYVEYQFRKKGSTSSSFAGGIGTVSKALGLLVSGFLISKFKPSARFLTGYNVLLGFLFFIFLIIFSFLGCPTSRVYGSMDDEGAINITSPCNFECGCPTARLQPICSKDGVTNFYSPCQAGCLSKAAYNPYEAASTKAEDKPKQTTVYEECSCVFEAWQKYNTTLSDEWIKKDYLTDWEYPSKDVIETVGKRVEDVPIKEAVDGWCHVDCQGVFKMFMLCIFVLMILASTGRIGNVLVALRCIDVQDKSLSMAFNVVFMSLFAMLPAPMVYGAIIDSTCILWQEECGETTNCLLYDTVALRRALMLTTAGISFFGVLLDIGTWYYSKDLVIFNPEQKIAKERQDEGEEDEETMALKRTGENYASNLSVAKDSIYKNGISLGN